MINIFNKLLAFVICTTLFFNVSTPVQAQNTVTAHLFYGNSCPHCAKERLYLKDLQDKYQNFNLIEYEIYNNLSNSLLLQKVASTLNTEGGGVPFLVIGDKSYVGFAEGITTKEIEARVVECSNKVCDDAVSPIIHPETRLSPEPISQKETNQDVLNKPQKGLDKHINIPIFGSVELSTLSLPILTLVMALLDGFNPCAMWTLLFLISLLLGLKDRKRMWILGATFIITSSLVYFLFLAAWLNLFLFIGFVVWIRLLIGLIALSAGYYNLREYWQNQKGGCTVMGDEKRQKIFEKLRSITQKRQFIYAFSGIILLAIAVNLVELICSAGLPAIYTQVLSLANLPRWQYYMYLLFYIFIFMLDDLFVFFTAMITLQAVGIQSKYARYSHLIGGFLMLLIGLLLIFKPQWLLFG